MGSLSRSQLLVYGAVGVGTAAGGRQVDSLDRLHRAEQGGVSYSSGSGSPVGLGGSLGDRSERAAATWSSTSRARWRARASTGCRRDPASTTPSSGPEAQPVGPTPELINLAARLADGQQVVMPGQGPGPCWGRRWARRARIPRRRAGPISLGTATVEDLDTIEGIGPVTAQDIVDFRDQHGGVSSVDQLDQIDGIGPATMDALRDRLQP